MIERTHLNRRDQLRKYVAERRMAKKPPRTQKEVAEKLGMSDKQFGQLVAEPMRAGKRNPGWRPIKEEAAREFETKLDLPERWLDVDGVLKIEANDPEPQPSDAVAESRRKNDVLALRHAMMGLAMTLHKTQPETAAEAARGAVVQSGVPFAKQGFLNVLLLHSARS
jgi:hypothetical protein